MTNTDNWPEIKAKAVAVLPANVVAFIDNALQGTAHSESHLIAILHMVQADTGWLPRSRWKRWPSWPRSPSPKSPGVATFYHYFRLQPRGPPHDQRVPGHRLLRQGRRQDPSASWTNLGIQFGETTKDGMFTLESTRCLGTCGLAPVVMIDDQVHGPVTPGEVSLILEKYLKKDKAVAKV